MRMAGLRDLLGDVACVPVAGAVDDRRAPLFGAVDAGGAHDGMLDPCVRRADDLIFDRADLPYLNMIEKFNCFYCSYGNGVAAFLREVAARTEQYWCPIKHSRRLLAPHEAYPRFFEFGDGRAYREGLDRLQRQYGATAHDPGPPGP